MAGIAKISPFDDTDLEAAITRTTSTKTSSRIASIHPRASPLHRHPGSAARQPPPVGFGRHALPNDPRPLQVRTLYVSGSLASHYRLLGEQLWVDAQPTDRLELEALWRLNEAIWPPWFRLYAILRIAGFLAGPITRNGDLAKTLLGDAEGQLVRSRTRDSQQQTTQKIRLTKVRSTRLGGRPM